MLKICLQVIDGKNTVLGNTMEVGVLQDLIGVYCMAKIIDSVVTFYGGGDYLYIRLLDNPYSLINLSKQYNVSTDVLYIGNKWGDSGIHEGTGLYTGSKYWCWKPLGFERGIIYG